MDEIIISTRAIAKEMNVSPQTIYRWIHRGMPYIQMRNGKRGYKLDEVHSWLLGEDMNDEK